MLAVVGGTAGLLLAIWAVRWIVSLSADTIPRVHEISVDPRVAGFTLLVSVFTGVLFGLAPAIQVSRPDLTDALKESGRATAGLRRSRLRSALVISEVALSLVLLVGAGLMIRSFAKLNQVDPGFKPDQVREIAERLSRASSVAALRLMTHLARADEDDGVQEQLQTFERACSGLSYPRSVANSAGVVRYDTIGGEYVRPGIMLYGSSPFPYDTADMLGLKAVMTLRSELIAVQDLKANDSVGYGGGYTAARAHRVGVIACGYADGYSRHAPNGTPVLVCGRKVRTAGRVSMDLMTVDLSDVPEAGIGSPAVLWGEGLSVDDVAAAASTVGYELLCAVTARVPFVTTEVGSVDIEL
jgi:alanine racemase